MTAAITGIDAYTHQWALKSATIPAQSMCSPKTPHRPAVQTDQCHNARGGRLERSGAARSPWRIAQGRDVSAGDGPQPRVDPEGRWVRVTTAGECPRVVHGGEHSGVTSRVGPVRRRADP